MTNDLLVSIIFMLALLLLANVVQILLTNAHNRRLAREIRGVEAVQSARYAYQVKLHREKKASEQLVPDALAWVAAQVNGAAEMAGQPVALQQIQRVKADLGAVEILATDGRRVVASLLTATELRKAEKPGRGRLAKAMADPLLDGARGVITVERSLLNAGDYFDLEAAQAGQLLGVPGWNEPAQLYFHVVPARTTSK